MALPRQVHPQRRPVPWPVLPAILLAAAVSAAAGGAVMSIDGDEPLPASRPPLSRGGSTQSRPGVGTPPSSPRIPCPRKCVDGQRPAVRQVALGRTDPSHVS